MESRIAGFHVSTSIRGKAIPIVYGTKRVPANLIWIGVWNAKPVGNKLKGGGGKGGANAQYDYFSDVILALCQGPIAAVGQLWVNNLRFYTSGGGSQVYVVPSGGGTYLPTFSNQIFIDAGVYVLNAYSVSVSDFGSPGSATLTGTTPVPLTSVTGQQVNSISLTFGGLYGSSSATPTVALVGGGGSGATAVVSQFSPVGAFKTVSLVTVVTGGSGYTSAPTVVFTGGSLIGASPTAFSTLTAPGGSGLSGGQYYFNSSTGAYVFGADMAGTTVQIGYVFNPVAINGETPTDGVGFAIITGDVGQSPWTYLQTPITTPASLPAGASSATVLFPGQNIGYTETALACSEQLELGSTGVLSNLSFEIFGFGIWGGGTGTGSTSLNATNPGIIDAPPFLPLPVATAVIVSGGISSITLSNVTLPYYAVPPFVQIIGDGTGATATAVLDASNQLTSITVTANGTGYTVANIFIGPTLQTAPAGIVFDLLTNPLWGAGLLPSDIGDLTDIGSYCIAHGIFLSLTVDTQRAASEYIKELLICANGEGFWSEGVLKFRTYGDTSAVGNGMLFVPQTAPEYDLDADDFIVDSPGKAGLTVERPSVRDAVNRITIEWDNRNNAYNSEPLDEYDQYAVDLYGLRPASTLKLSMVTTQPVAQIIANVQTQRSCYIRNKYKFKLAVTYALLDPMDLVTITDPELGLFYYPVRILSIEEDDKQCLQIEAEDFPWGTAKPTINPKEVSSTFGPGYFAQPGYTNPPNFIDLPEIAILHIGASIGIGLSGPIQWGGCTVHLSTDGGNSYTSIGRQNGAATMGITTASLPAAVDPDLINTLAVYLGESFGALESVTAAEWNNFENLVAVDDELIAIENVALTSAFAYNCTDLHRGCFDSIIGTHASGAPFTVVDETLFNWKYGPSNIGTTVYFKFTAFNQYGQNEQSLAAVPAYPWFVTGPRVPYPWNSTYAIQSAGAAEQLQPATFAIQQSYIPNADGSQLAQFLINGYGQVNSFSTITRPPLIVLTSTTTGGTFAGGSTIVVGVCAQDANFDLTQMTLESFTFPTGTNTNKLVVTVVFFTPATDSGTVFIALNPDEGWGAVATINVSSTVANVTGLPTYFLSQAPDPETDSYLVRATTDIHGGIWGGIINAVVGGSGVTVVTVTGSTWTVGQLVGRTFSKLASANITNPMPVLNVLITANTADTFTLAVDVVSGTQYLFPDDVGEIRTLATTFSATTIGDSNYVNGGAGQPGTGLTPSDEINNLVWIIKGTGAGQQRLITANTTTTLTVSVPWDITPDATSMFIIIDPTWPYQNPSSSNIDVMNALTPIGLNINIPNVSQGTFVVQVLTVDANGNTSEIGFSPYREIFQPGMAGSIQSATQIAL